MERLPYGANRVTEYKEICTFRLYHSAITKAILFAILPDPNIDDAGRERRIFPSGRCGKAAGGIRNYPARLQLSFLCKNREEKFHIKSYNDKNKPRYRKHNVCG